MAQVLIEEADILRSFNSSNETTPDITYPAYVTGDLLIQFLGVDDDIASFPLTTPATGPNGETLILDTTGSNGVSGGPSVGAIANNFGKKS